MLGAGVIIIAVGLLSSPYPTPARTVPSAWQTAAAALLRHPADDAALAELERLSTVLRDPETGEPERDVTTAAPSVVAALQAAVQARPDDARPRRLLGLTLLAAGLPRAAVVELRRAGDPSVLTLALLRAGRPEEVLDLPALRDPQPGNAALLIARGRAFEMLRRYDDAAAALRQASAADPADPNPVARLGLLLLWQGDREGALRALRTATALDPQARATLRLSAEYAYATRDFAASAAAYDRLIALGAPERYDPIPPSLGKARALIYQGDLQRAATVLDQTRLPRDDPPVGYYRALLAFRAGDFAQASELARPLVGRLRDFPPLHLLIGLAMLANGYPETARDHLQRYVAAIPANTVAEALLRDATRLSTPGPSRPVPVASARLYAALGFAVP